MGPSFLPFPQLLPLAIAECPGPQLTLCRHAHERNARVVVAFFFVSPPVAHDTNS